MNNNDILRRTRYILDLKDNQITKIYKHVGFETSEKQVNRWLKREDEPEFLPLTDEELVLFLDALIIEKRGKKDEGPYVKTNQLLDNNLILMKLKIAFHLKAEEALAVMDLAGFKISKHEFSALFRKKDHKHYRACKNQMLRKFMKGMQIKYRGGMKSKEKTVISDLQQNENKGRLSLKKKKSTNQEQAKHNHINQDKAVKDHAEKKTNNQPANKIWKIPKKKPID